MNSDMIYANDKQEATMLNCPTQQDRAVAVNSVIYSEFCGASPVLYTIVNHLKTNQGKIVSYWNLPRMDSKQVFMAEHFSVLVCPLSTSKDGREENKKHCFTP